MLSINGAGSYVQTPDVQALHLAHGFTIECWAKQSSISSFPALIDKGNGATSFWGIYFDTSSAVFGALRHSAAPIHLYSQPLDSPNVWHHYAFVFRPNDSLYLYIDTLEAASASAKGMADIDTSKDNIRVGASGAGSSLLGAIDEVRIWNVPQTLSQIKSNLFRTLGTGDSTLVLYYSFDDEAGATHIHDFSGHGRDGYLRGSYSGIVPSSSPMQGSSHGFSLGAKELKVEIPSKRCNPSFDTIIHIRNVGTQPLVVNSYGFYLGKSFSIIANFPITLPADSTYSYPLQLHFSPSGGGSYDDSIYISSGDECAGTLRIGIHATYDSVGLSCNPAVLNFGPRTQCQLPERQSMTVYNTSSTDSVTILSQSIPAGSGLSIVTPLPLVVQRNDSAQLVVQLVRGNRGPVSAKLSVSLDKCSRLASVTVLGIRELAEISVPPTISFGTFQSSLAGVSRDTIVTVTNTGDVQENILNVSALPTGLLSLLDGRKGISLSPGDTAQIRVRMFATSCGHFSATLHVQGGLSCVMDTACILNMDVTPPQALFAPAMNAGRVCTYHDDTLLVTNPNNYAVQFDTVTFADKVVFYADPVQLFWHSQLAPHQVLRIPIRFFPPPQPGDYVDTAYLHMSPCGTGIVILTGTLGFKDLTTTPNSLNFGRGCDTATTSRTVTIFNGSQQPISLVDSIHTGSQRFVIAPTPLPLTLQPGQVRTISVTYTPRLGTKDTGSFNLLSSDGCPIVVIPLRGSREKASVQWPLASGEFDTVCPGETKVISIPLINAGVDTINIVKASVSGVGFSLDSVPTALGPSGTIRVRFAPLVRSDYTGGLQLTGDKCGTAFSLPLHGSAGPAPSITPIESQHDFRSVLAGDSVEYCLPITNPSCTAIPLTVSGLASTPFTIVGSSGLSGLSRGDTAHICVRYRPTGHDTSVAILFVRSDSAPTQSLSLHGVGLAADVRLDKHLLDFGYVLRNTSKQDTIVISNVGNYPATITASKGRPQFVSTLRSTIGTLMRDSLLISFTPSSIGLLVDTIPINWNGHLDTVIVRGYGTDAGLQLSSVGVDFGDVHVGHDSTRTLVLTATNVFPRVDSFSVAFEAVDSFTVRCDSGLPFRIGTSQDTLAIGVTYHAHLEQRDTGILSIYTDAGVVAVPLTGRGVEAHPRVNILRIDFTPATIGDPSPPNQPISITMHDSGGYEVFVHAIAQDANFSIGPDLPSIPILADSSRVFAITFHPTRARKLTHVLQFTTSSPDAIPPILLTGTGLYPAGQGPSFGFSVASETVNAGDRFSIPIMLNGIRLDKIDADSLLFRLHYDPAMLALHGVTPNIPGQTARLDRIDDSTVECVLVASSFATGEIVSLQAEALLGPHPVSYIRVDSADPSPDIQQPATDGMITELDCFGPVQGVIFTGNYTVSAIKPNPSKENAVLDFELGLTGSVTIDLYNTVGQIVRRLNFVELKQGPHSANVDVSGLPEGKYVYQLKSLDYHTEGSLIIQH